MVCAVEQKFHIPVMLKEVVEYLNLKPGQVIVDGTMGTGGHSEAILERIMPSGKLIGIDRDQDSLEVAKARLSNFGDACKYIYANFIDIDTVLAANKIKKIDGLVLDLGISSFQLNDPKRGFSFQNEGPLDMRIDRNSHVSAYDLVNNLNEEEISSLLWHFGQERMANRIARFLVRERERHSIDTTTQLSEVVMKAMPYKYRFHRIHPATRTFQAMRIAVNRELETLEQVLNKAINILNKGARICVISFHSLEDRIVKLSFRKAASVGLVKIITPKPLVPQEDEVRQNSSSRSAKFRVAERLINQNESI